MLSQRLFSASIIISTILLLIWFDFKLGTEESVGRPGLVLGALSLILIAMATVEMIGMWAQRIGLNRGLALVASVAMGAVANMPLLWDEYPADCPIGKFGWSVAGLVIAIVIVFLYEMKIFESSSENLNNVVTNGEVTDRIAHYVLCFGYLFLLFGFLTAHRTLKFDNSLGMFSIIMLIASVKMSDSFAYFTGKSLGNRKITPRLSPKKTLEGALGAFVGAWFASAICIFVVAPYVFVMSIDKPFWWMIVYGVLVTLAGMAGDLAVSLLKRDSNCKDSGNWLPGLGGILDVIDSLVFAAPVSYFLWIA